MLSGCSAMLSGCLVILSGCLLIVSDYLAIPPQAFEHVLRRPVGGSTRIVHSDRCSDRAEVCRIKVVESGHDPSFVGAVDNKAFGARA